MITDSGLWDRKNGREAVKFLLTNRVHWEISRILNVYRKRWTGTETRLFIGTASTIWAWETVSYAAARARPGIGTS